ncbi:MAG: A/G-specific adenine glycosylase [Myxococcales bacterium]|nr:A/G-specific adenine glycosylase [Myxococcales bacterium]
MDRIRDALLAHFDEHKRAMPWRETKDPYAIWVSEVMLQQTRVETVIPYYQRFLSRFESVRALAEASEADVLALWSGLGYYRRARMLHAGAKHVLAEHRGELPKSPEALLAIPGVGRYTAGAIASIAFDLREPVLDGNVERVLTRLDAIHGDPQEKDTRNTLWSLARAFADHPRAGTINQALMELGATLCTPTSPQCLLCPARAECRANAIGEQTRFPEKPPKKAPRVERWTAIVLRDADDNVWLGPPPATLDRWKGMLVTPLVREGDDGLASLVRASREVATVTHVLTHARMEITVRVGVVKTAPDAMEGRFVAMDALDSLAIPKVTRVILEAAAQRSTSPESTASASARKNASIRARKGRATKGSSTSKRT